MIRPRGPNENTIAIEVVNGGEISGRNVARSISQRNDAASLTRSTVNANTKPIAVPANPTSAASSRLLRSARRLFGDFSAPVKAPSESPPSSNTARCNSMTRG